MVSLMALLLPILLSSVLVFIASSLIHMFLKYHGGDYRMLPRQDEVMEALRKFEIPPGDYMVPRAGSTEAMRTPEFKAKLEKGPVMVATVMPNGMFQMGKSMTQWFLFCVLVGVFTAYIAGRALPPGAAYLRVFQIAGTVAFVAYSLGQFPNSIWYQKSWATTLRHTFDGLIFGMLTGGTFGWLWPK
ncbi:MAG TPA: hypothetical protein VMJ70_10125 [Candidatus Sulfotelmatobacter sp.]|nr:hypothetical protein [Candidatus Sulfotelmatobacter sp.]